MPIRFRSNRLRFPPALSACALACALIQGPSPALATIYTWNAGSGLTNTSVNWSPSTGTPGANDDTRFWQSVTYGITVASPVDTFATLWVSSAGHPQFICSNDPLRVRNQFNVDGGVTASVTSGFARAGWFTVGPASLTITGNGTQAAATNPSASTYIGSQGGGFTSTLNVSGGAGFTAPTIYVPEFTNTTGIISVAGHVTNGPSSTLHVKQINGYNSGIIYVGNQGVGDVEVFNGGVMNVDSYIELGPYAYGKLHMYRSTILAPVPTLTTPLMYIGFNNVTGSPGGTGTLAIDLGTAGVGEIFMGDEDGGSPDSIRMTGGSLYALRGLRMDSHRNAVLDLRGGTTVLGFSDIGVDIEQSGPLTLSGSPTLTIYAGGQGGPFDLPVTQINTTSALSLAVGRNSGGTFRVIGDGLPYLALGLSGAAVIADSSSGTGTVVVDTAAAFGTANLTVGPGNGVVQVRRGSLLAGTSYEADFVGGASIGASVLVSDTTSELNYNITAIGGTANAAVPGTATLTVDSSATIVGPLVRVWKGGGHLLMKTRALCWCDSLLCSGNLELATGTVKTDVVGIRGPVRISDTGLLHGIGTVLARVQLADSTAELAILSTDPAGGKLTVGDSTAADGFTSSGTTEVDQDTLVILNHGQASLGHGVMGGGTLRLPQGGHVRTQDVLEGTAGRIEGDVLVDGQLHPAGSIDAAGHVTCLTGALLGSYLNVLPGADLSTRGTQAGTVRNGGQLDMGPNPALLTMTGTLTLLSTSNLRMRIGSKASHVQDTLAMNHAVTLNGTLDLRNWKPAPPQAGDTITVITGPSISGTFTSVTIDSANAPSYIQPIYSPTSVKIAILQSTADVPPPTTPSESMALRFAALGAPVDPALELDLPATADAQVSLYDVMGRRVATLAQGTLAAGRHRFTLAQAPLAGGVYFARARVRSADGVRVLTARVVRLR